ncbi:anti-sigma factor RsiW [Pseudarthrobacter defluvii]|uniref:anti-sigma factor n=1 Tax=Pseudarthrobacter defluvii TaxID=410837 RepID=UPI0027829A88|nr:anti-sigma factor [Pseudarthrobacter defluvii]MDQ0771017.1 anti-sigma factor RsiW [Pseudarthrobacter defluvii]
MPHLDPEQLSLLALYDDWEDPAGREHLLACPECAADYAALRRTVDAVRTTPDTSRLSVPGPQVWAGIHRELGLAESVREDPLASEAPKEGAAGDGASTKVAATPAATPAPGDVPPSNVVPLGAPRNGARTKGARRKAVWWQHPGTWLATAAAAALVVFGVVSVMDRPPQPQELAATELAPLPKHSAAGTAKVVAAADGSRSLEVSLDKDEAKGYQEVWLIAPDLSKLVSLGVMNSTSGTFQVPAGLDLSQYPVVDVSDEPMDGNPAHSSVSIARGTFTS